MATKVIEKYKLESGMKTFILKAIRTILEDSDFGLELTERAKKRLREASRTQKTISSSLRWRIHRFL